jgi:LmbE family N-acetylglucosaminyl deacetylase
VPQIYNIVSPHLDDVALSCSLFLAANRGSRIITIFSGGPSSVSPLPSWDKASRYFFQGADVMAIRRGEDISAAAMVNASTLHLNYWDTQYRTTDYGYHGEPDEKLPCTIAEDLSKIAQEHSADAWVIPLGLSHTDHRIAAEAGLIFAHEHPNDVYLYEELPYAAERSRAMSERKNSLTKRGFVLEACPEINYLQGRALKAAVIRCHASQRRALGRRIRTALGARERIWRLRPPA